MPELWLLFWCELSRPTVAQLEARRRRVQAVKVLDSRTLAMDDGDVLEAIKQRCAQRSIPYDSVLVEQAWRQVKGRQR